MTDPAKGKKPVSVFDLGFGNPAYSAGLRGGGPGDWKFVIIEATDARYLVLGPVARYKYHAGLVKRFCELQGVACLTVKKPDLVEVVERGVRIRGGGRVRFDKPSGVVHFFDSSRAYGQFDRDELTEILGSSDFLEGLSVQIDRG